MIHTKHSSVAHTLLTIMGLKYYRFHVARVFTGVCRLHSGSIMTVARRSSVGSGTLLSRLFTLASAANDTGSLPGPPDLLGKLPTAIQALRFSRKNLCAFLADSIVVCWTERPVDSEKEMRRLHVCTTR